MKSKIFLLVFFLLATQVATAQIMFQEHYGGAQKESGGSVLQTDDGGYIIAGYTESYGSGGDIYLLKTDQNGNMQWIKTFGGVGLEQASSIIKTNDSGYIIAGATSSFGYGGSDVYCIKVDMNFDTLWTKTYGGSFDDEGYDIIQTSDSGYLITGYSMSFTSGFSSIYVIKTDKYGDTLWTKTYNKKNANMGSSVIKDISNGYLIVGTTSNYGISNTKDCFIIRINSIGDTLWTKTIGGSFDDYSVSTVITNNGDFIVCGTTNSIGNGYFDVYYFKINSTGDIIWSKTIGGMEYDDGRMIIPTTDSGFAIIGTTNSFGAGGNDIYLMKLDLNGDTLWTRTFGSSGDDMAGSIRETNDGGYIISGITNSFGNNYDVYLIKTDANGISGFEKIIHLNLTCIVYPNPCKGILNIQMNNCTSNFYFIELFNISGQLVHCEKYENKNSMNNQLNLTNYPKGFYLLRISSYNQTIIKKIIYY
ncbi:MAG: T9SS type A sorting domain-containing protein [Bacteroidales bacterium]|jgi:hypothetical protein|nr:T9SS type A sorting domain-containing protein [Bacteroidales bacterium]